jgi:uncharacterized membrane protein YphA (DoxX/SURF4 family)
MQDSSQVDSHVFLGNRQLKMWRPRHPQIDRRILLAILCTRISLCEDIENARGTETFLSVKEMRAKLANMTTNATPLRKETIRVAEERNARVGLALVRLTIGAMFCWVFFENLGKGAYTPAGYAGLINYYIKASHSPAAWKAVMGLMASHAAMAAPMQAITELSLGVLLIIGLLTRPVAFVAFLFLASLWVSEWGTAWIWELLVPVLTSFALSLGRAGRAWGADAWLAQRWPSSPWW